jgi:hypothetical protein
MCSNISPNSVMDRDDITSRVVDAAPNANLCFLRMRLLKIVATAPVGWGLFTAADLCHRVKRKTWIHGETRAILGNAYTIKQRRSFAQGRRVNRRI